MLVYVIDKKLHLIFKTRMLVRLKEDITKRGDMIMMISRNEIKFTG